MSLQPTQYTLINRVDPILHQILNESRNLKDVIIKEYYVEMLTNLIIDLSDPLIREPLFFIQEIKSCLDLVETIQRVYGAEDYRIFVVGWVLVSGVFNTLATLEPLEKEPIINRLQSMFDILIQFRCLKDVNSLEILRQPTTKEEYPAQLIPFMKERLNSQLPIIIEHVKKDYNLLIALMGLRALAYHQRMWRCIENILKTDILLPLLRIASDSYNIVNYITDNWTETYFPSKIRFDFGFNLKPRKVIHLICNEVIRLITNLTSGEFETTKSIVDQKAIPFFSKVLDSSSQDLQHYALNGIGNIIFEKEQWRDEFIETYSLLDKTKAMLSDPIVKTTTEFLEDFSNIFAAVTYGDTPSILWETITDILPYVNRYLMCDSATTRGNVTRILEYITLHSEFDYHVLERFGFDKFLVDNLNSDHQYILEPSIYAIGNIFQKAQVGTRSLVSNKLMDPFKRILNNIDNQHLMRLVLWIISNMVVGEGVADLKGFVIDSKIIQLLSEMVARYPIEDPPMETNLPPVVEKPTGTSIIIESKTVEEIMWVIGNLICNPISDEEVHECVEQGILMLLCKLYPYVPSETCYLNLSDSLEYILTQDNHLLYMAHLIQLGFHNLTPNTRYDPDPFEALLNFFNQTTNPNVEEDYLKSMSFSKF
ncbi:hypothetical protein DFA_07536 [Cavenderia fasciculata]|uniref:Uncharacterized protein n=1 Tax=Cavenderia fasciculata TaxID=261658 RepID=F4PWP8_CACFS|nr:uncharacterized protein DFA_07536 [Cavenderia fasciculata]EGG20412.1 hypothetical protein DFA_07536 [Cavenderia fasciculata]|eukprot:XP_004367395.1 hypothetical protein DFA_07536 [Cavenderia fasciculata]